MHTILSTFLAIYALSADALVTFAPPATQPGTAGELGHDANLMIYLWPSASCDPPADYHTANLSWGTMQPIPATMSFSYSRPLNPTENLDWSGFAPDDLGPKGTRAENGLSACAHYLETKDGPFTGVFSGLRPALSCTNLTVAANVSDSSAERPECTDHICPQCVNVWDERYCPPYVCHK